MHFAQPDSGTNHGTSMSIQVGEILGYTNLDHIRLVWGDTDLAPSSPGWNSGLTTQLQGGALCNAADKMRKELLKRASAALKVDAAKLQIRDGVISSTDDPKKKITFAELVEGQQRQPSSMIGRCLPSRGDRQGDEPRHRSCFAEVEVDTWTGDWRYVRAAYCTRCRTCHESAAGERRHARVADAEHCDDDRRHSVGPGISGHACTTAWATCPTGCPRSWSRRTRPTYSSTAWSRAGSSARRASRRRAIGAPPGALANAIYNACGVRIREHPITKDTIMAGLKAKGREVIA